MCLDTLICMHLFTFLSFTFFTTTQSYHIMHLILIMFQLCNYLPFSGNKDRNKSWSSSTCEIFQIRTKCTCMVVHKNLKKYNVRLYKLCYLQQIVYSKKVPKHKNYKLRFLYSNKSHRRQTIYDRIQILLNKATCTELELKRINAIMHIQTLKNCLHVLFHLIT